MYQWVITFIEADKEEVICLNQSEYNEEAIMKYLKENFSDCPKIKVKCVNFTE